MLAHGTALVPTLINIENFPGIAGAASKYPTYAKHMRDLYATCHQRVAAAHDAGVPISVDVAAATRIESHGPGAYVDLLAGLRPDVLFCNAAEATVLGLDGDLPSWAPGLVLVHAGARPTRVLTRAGVWEVPVEPLPQEGLRDTTGCGDGFAAGVLAGWRAGVPVLHAVRAGHAAAAAVAGVVGAQPPS
jgi:sugar/nucleoside kinase (ribokinase family)